MDYAMLGEEIAVLVNEAIAKATGPILSRLEQAERKLAEVEAKGLQYCGTWQRAQDYTRGDVVTHHGSAWVALTTVRAEPGSDTGWQLMVKRGRDA